MCDLLFFRIFFVRFFCVNLISIVLFFVIFFSSASTSENNARLELGSFLTNAKITRIPTKCHDS